MPTDATTQTGTTQTQAGTETQQTAQTTQTTAAQTTQQTVAQTQQTAQPDWRTRMAGEDKDALKRLERFADEGSFFKSYRALESKLSSGELKRALPEGATPEEVSTWRKENGIPEKHEDYVAKLALPNGMVLGEADKPIAESFAKRALDRNWTPQQYNDAVSWYYETQDAQAAAREDADILHKQTSEDALRNVWQGPDFRINIAAVNNWTATWPKGLADKVLAGRTADGRKMGDDVEFIRMLATTARELNPTATLLPAGTGDPAKGVSDRIGELKKLMGNRSSDYWKGPTANALQQEYRDLLTAREKMKSRAA